MCLVALKVKMSDRAWMYTGHTGQNKWSTEWFTKTKGFVRAAFANGQRKTWCPCLRCGNWEKRTEAEMGKHLQKSGFTPDYTVWTFHGESAQRDRAEVDRRRTDEHGTGMENMVQDFDDARDSDEEMEESAKAFNEMLESSKRPLHEHTELCQLDAISQVMALKAQFNLGRECYDAMMTVFGRFLPKGHVMPANLYQSDKILRALKMPYDKIHACEKGCVLFRLDYADLNYCPICKSSRYVVVDNGMGEKTQTKIPVSVLRYMPIVPRLQRLFMVEETARQMTWHKTGKRTELDADGNLMIVHTSDGVAWKKFDELHGDKAADPRHPRVGISTDGFSVFGMTAAQYSCWPVFVFPLNLPPGQIMQRKNIFLTLIIPGPNYPGKNMNVYMQPLKDELQEAWDNGFKTYDAYSKRNFIMRVWYMYSTHDLPAYALFVGWCVHGRFPCPTCKGALEFRWLQAGRKFSCFDMHRQFLNPRHKFRKDKKNFIRGRVVKNSAPPALTGQQTLDQLNALEPDPQRPGYFKGYNSKHAWTHKTCLWDLPYFKDLLCPHNIDVMHTEKNIAEALFGTLFGIDGKSKDNTKARVDLEALCDRPLQNMKEPKGKQNWTKPKAWFNLGRPAMREIILWVKMQLMFPDGYAANLKRGASLDKLKIFGLKSHDWHIWIERVMPVMLRGFIPEDEWLVLAELSYFFRVLCAKELSPGVLEEMEELAPELICKLEKIFPPGFFNPMQHLILHLPTEARLGGPVQNRWCYPTERMQKTLRQKCKNKRRIEASMAEAFITEEAANFVTAHYEAKNRHLHNPKPRYNADDPKKGGSNLSLFKGNLAPASVSNPVSLDNEQWRTISLYIFNNLIEVRPYIE